MARLRRGKKWVIVARFYDPEAAAMAYDDVYEHRWGVRPNHITHSQFDERIRRKIDEAQRLLGN